MATQVVSREDIEASGAENLADALEEAPSLRVVPSFRGSGLRLQGLDPDHTLLLLDGHRTTGRIDGAIDLRRFTTEDVDRVEVVRGPGSVLYGSDAIGGVVNVITREPTHPLEMRAHGAYGSFNTADVTGRLASAWRRGSATVSGGWHQTDGWDRNPSDEATTGNAIRQWNLAHRGRLGSGRPLRVTFGTGYLRRDMRGVDSNASGGVFDRRNLTETVDASLDPELVAADGSRLRLTGHYTLFRDQYLQDQRGSSELDVLQQTWDHLGTAGAQYDAQVRGHRFTLGAEFIAERMSTDRIDPGNVERQRFALFAQDEWVPSESPRVALLPGARVDFDSQFGVYATPRILLFVAPVSTLRLRAGYGRGFRAPSFKEMYLAFSNPSAGYRVQGNQGLRPESSWSTTFGAEYEPASWLWASVVAFDHRLRDQIVIDTASEDAMATVFRYENVGASVTQGIETMFELRVREFVRLQASYTLLHAEDLERRRALPGRAVHAGTVALTLAYPQWGTRVDVRSAVTGRRRFFADQDGDGIDDTTVEAPFATLDIRASQRFLRVFAVFVGVENLLDVGNATTTPLAPRSFYGGLTIAYDLQGGRR